MVFILGFVVLITWLVKRLKKPALKKPAMAKMNAVIEAYHQHADKEILLQQLSMALRQILLSYRGRSNVAGLTGADWSQEIIRLDRKNVLSKEMITMLSHWPYQKYPQVSDDQIELLISQLTTWSRSLARDHTHA